MRAYCDYICMTPPADPLEACYGYVDAFTSNIRAFLRDKPHVVQFELEKCNDLFPQLLETIGGWGDLNCALAEWT